MAKAQPVTIDPDEPFGVAARPSDGLLPALISRLALVSVDDAHSSILTSSGCALPEKFQVVPPFCIASISSAAEPATNGAAIEVPKMLV